jgi:hypothetical protein
MAVQATMEPMSKGAWFMLFLALMIPVAGFLGPYALRMATSRWAWSGNGDSLTGTWVGTLSTTTPALHGLPAVHRQTPALIEMHMQVFTWLSHVAGTVKTCQGGSVAVSTFKLGDVILGGPDGDRVRLFFSSDPGFQPVRAIRKDNQLMVTMGNADGTLHKGSEADFNQLCQ